MKTPQWRELCAKHIREGRQQIVGVVLHDTVGRGTHRDTRYLVNPNRGREISADFSVERDGSVWKLNPDLNRYYCLHAGRATAFKGLTNAEVTRATIGIEICQHRDLKLKPLYPEAQVKSVAELCAWISKEFQLTAEDITTHHQIITDGSRSDPRDFPFEGPSGFWSFYRQALERGDEFVACETTSESGRNRLRRIAVKLTRLVRFSRS